MNRIILYACVLLSIPIALGCGTQYRVMEYDTVFITGRPGGDYFSLSTGETFAGNKFSRDAVADIFIRLDDGSVFRLPDFPENEAKARRRPESNDPNVAEGVAYYNVGGTDSTISLYYRHGKLIGASLGGSFEICRSEQGPFVKLPISSTQVRELFGEPKREFTRRAPMKWN